MLPVACAEAIQIYSSAAPREWPNATRSLRPRWIDEKRQALKHFASVCHPRLNVIDRRPVRPSFLKRAAEFAKPTEVIAAERFGTDWIDGAWRILAPGSLESLGDFSALEHERGHAIVNADRREQSLRDIIRSEALAMSLEELSLMRVLRGDELGTWFQYQRSLDDENEFFFALEIQCSTRLLHDRFAFRESLWTSHGYQMIYAAASRLRRKVLHGS